jgi:hypothetical protein
MWWSENAVPRWLERSVVAAFLTLFGSIAAIVAILLFFAVFPAPLFAVAWEPLSAVMPDRLGAWLFWHAEVFYLVPLASAVALAFVVDRVAFARR